MRLFRSSLTMALALALGLGLGLPQPPMAAVEPSSAVQASPQPPAYQELRPQLLAALRDCTSPQPLALCEPASQGLQELIAISERATAHELRPHCLGALTLLETHLTVFRWGFEPRQRLDPVIQQVEQACPAPLSPPPAASN